MKVRFFSNIEEAEKLVVYGDLKSFAFLVRTYDPELRPVAWSVLGNEADVNDVMQISYEKALKNLGGFQGKSSFKTWLYSICYRSSLNYLEYEKRRRHVDVDSIDITDSISLDDVVIGKTSLNELFKILEPEQRTLLMSIYGLELSFDETAEMLGMARGTVASKVTRLKKKLAKQGLI